MVDNSSFGTDRRTFMKQAAGTVLAAGMDARSYARVVGANDRIRLAQLGCGGLVMATCTWSSWLPRKYQLKQ
jgi:hypothetical protein